MSALRRKLRTDTSVEFGPDTRVIRRDLVLHGDTEFNENLVVLGNILCKGRMYSLTVHGDLKAKDVVVANLSVDRNTWARNLHTYRMDGQNLSVVRDITGGEFSVKHVSADSFSALKINARGDIAARTVYSSTSIRAKDLLVTGEVIANNDIRIRNADVGGIRSEGDIYYYRILVYHWSNGLNCSAVHPEHEKARHFLSRKPINIKKSLYQERRD